MGGYLAAHPSDNDNFNNTNRVNNAIKYTSPVFHGLTATALYSLGGVSGHTGRNQIWSAGASYTNGPLSMGAGYLNVRNPNTSFYGAGGTVAATVNGVPGPNFGASPVISGYASAHTLQVIGTGAAYTIGSLTLGATYSNTQFRHLGDTTSGPVPAGGISGTAKLNNAELNVRYQITPAFIVGANYVRRRTAAPMRPAARTTTRHRSAPTTSCQNAPTSTSSVRISVPAEPIRPDAARSRRSTS